MLHDIESMSLQDLDLLVARHASSIRKYCNGKITAEAIASVLGIGFDPIQTKAISKIMRKLACLKRDKGKRYYTFAFEGSPDMEGDDMINKNEIMREMATLMEDIKEKIRNVDEKDSNVDVNTA